MACQLRYAPYRGSGSRQCPGYWGQSCFVDRRQASDCKATPSLFLLYLLFGSKANGHDANKARRNAAFKAAITFVPPAIALVAAIIAMSFFYGVNASTTNDSLQSWTCRWKDVTMNVQPHFGTLCKQSRAGVALSVMLVPVEAIILGLAAYQFTLEKRFDLGARGPSRKAGSPALS